MTWESIESELLKYLNFFAFLTETKYLTAIAIMTLIFTAVYVYIFYQDMNRPLNRDLGLRKYFNAEYPSQLKAKLKSLPSRELAELADKHLLRRNKNGEVTAIDENQDYTCRSLFLEILERLKI
jgi:hypothetical protein